MCRNTTKRWITACFAGPREFFYAIDSLVSVTLANREESPGAPPTSPSTVTIVIREELCESSQSIYAITRTTPSERLRRLVKLHQPRNLVTAPGETPCRPSSGAGGKNPPTRRWWPHGFGAEAGRIPGGGASRTTRRRGLRRGRRGGGATASASASCHGRRTFEGQLDPRRHVFVELFQGTSSMLRAGGDA